MEQTSVPVPDVSVMDVALEEEAMEIVSSFAGCFLPSVFDDGGNARLGILDNVDVFEFSFVALLFDFSFFFLLQMKMITFIIENAIWCFDNELKY